MLGDGKLDDRGPVPPTPRGPRGKGPFVGRPLPGVEDCIFCGKAAVSGEHLFPDWINRRFAKPDSPMPISQTLNGEQVDSWNAYELASIEIRAVCVMCNNEWMSEIENDASVHLKPMIDGHALTLTPRAQVELATWITLKAMVFEAVAQYPSVTAQSNRDLLRTQRRPPSYACAYLARFDARFDMSVSRRYVMGERTPGSAQAEAAVVVLTTGPVVAAVLLSPTLPTHDFTIPGGRALQYMVIYPPTFEPIQWPPHQALTPTEHDSVPARFLAVRNDNCGGGSRSV